MIGGLLTLHTGWQQFDVYVSVTCFWCCHCMSIIVGTFKLTRMPINRALFHIQEPLILIQPVTALKNLKALGMETSCWLTVTGLKGSWLSIRRDPCAFVCCWELTWEYHSVYPSTVTSSKLLPMSSWSTDVTSWLITITCYGKVVPTLSFILYN